jgi:hypothetical protein
MQQAADLTRGERQIRGRDQRLYAQSSEGGAGMSLCLWITLMGVFALFSILLIAVQEKR